MNTQSQAKQPSKPSAEMEAALTRIYNRMQQHTQELAETIEKALIQILTERLNEANNS